MRDMFRVQLRLLHNTPCDMTLGWARELLLAGTHKAHIRDILHIPTLVSAEVGMYVPGKLQWSRKVSQRASQKVNKYSRSALHFDFIQGDTSHASRHRAF